MTDSFSSPVVISDLLFSVVWIIGFSIIFAALSMHHYSAQTKNIPFHQQLQTAGFQLPLWLGFLMVTSGFAGVSATLWEQLVWGILAFLSAIQLYFSAIEYRTQRVESN